MFSLDEKKIEFALGKKALVFWQGKKAKNYVFLIFNFNVEICGISLSLTLGTAKFKQLD